MKSPRPNSLPLPKLAHAHTPALALGHRLHSRVHLQHGLIESGHGLTLLLARLPEIAVLQPLQRLLHGLLRLAEGLADARRDTKTLF